MQRRSESSSAASSAMLGAAAMIAYQVGGKATRDTLFLTHFAVTSLPLMFIGSALFSLALALLTARAMTRRTPARVIPPVFGLSALLMLGEWALLSQASNVASVLVYLHVTGLGGVLISGFWSIINERFDPRTGKRQIGRIAGGATFGGLVGGLAAERAAAMFSAGAMLPVLALLHGICAWMLGGLDRNAGARVADPITNAPTAPREPAGESAWNILKRVSYLRNLALLVVLATISNVAIDYVFIAQASQSFGQGESLMRFFALFYTAVGVGTFLVQTLFSRLALQQLGLARTVGTWPLAVATTGIAALTSPSLVTAGVARGLGSVVNDSLFRSGYELLYTPIPANEKRSTKTLVDVGCGRLGDLLGGVVIRVILSAAPGAALSAILSVAVLLAVVSLWVATRLNEGYIVSLERSLLNRAVELDLTEVRDGTTRTALLRALRQSGAPFETLAGGSIRQTTGGVPPPPGNLGPSPAKPAAVPAASKDPMAARVSALRSGDRQRVTAALRKQESLDPALAPHVIPLLAWDDVFPDALAVLRKLGLQITGLLVNALLDSEESFAVRRRIPRAIAASPSRQSAEGLMMGLGDSRFEVRYQCGIALESIVLRNPDVAIPAENVLEAVAREVRVGKKVWESQRLLDRIEDSGSSPWVDDFIRQRAGRGLEHVFRVLSLALPKEPLRIAFRGLHTTDENLRGTALEYLESVLPATIREPLWPYLEDHRPRRQDRRSVEEILNTLVRSHESIELNLGDLRRKWKAEQQQTVT